MALSRTQRGRNTQLDYLVALYGQIYDTAMLALLLKHLGHKNSIKLLKFCAEGLASRRIKDNGPKQQAQEAIKGHHFEKYMEGMNLLRQAVAMYSGHKNISTFAIEAEKHMQTYHKTYEEVQKSMQSQPVDARQLAAERVYHFGTIFVFRINYFLLSIIDMPLRERSLIHYYINHQLKAPNFSDRLLSKSLAPLPASERTGLALLSLLFEAVASCCGEKGPGLMQAIDHRASALDYELQDAAKRAKSS